MTSNVGTRPASNRVKDLARAYEGEVPPPFYWQIPNVPLRASSRHRPGQIETTLPYSLLPDEFLFVPAISLEQIDELMERRARREEIAGR
jgi:hypothetical protein